MTESTESTEKGLLRSDWDTYYLTIANIVAQRSFDPSTKCGCVLVSRDGRVLSTGYNGPLRGAVDEEIPLTRPAKYFFFIHSEENALLAYNGSYQDIQGATAYVTGRPCHRCLRGLIQKGIRRIVYGTNHTICVDDEDINAQKIMLDHKRRKNDPIEMVELDNSLVKELLYKTQEYIAWKEKQLPIPNYKKE